MTALWFAQMLQQDKLGDDVAIVSRRGICNAALVFEPAGYPVQCLIGEFIGSRAVSAVEVSSQPAAHLEVSFASGVRTFVEPVEQLAERGLGWGPVLLQRGRYDCRVSP